MRISRRPYLLSSSITKLHKREKWKTIFVQTEGVLFLHSARQIVLHVRDSLRVRFMPKKRWTDFHFTAGNWRSHFFQRTEPVCTPPTPLPQPIQLLFFSISTFQGIFLAMFPKNKTGWIHKMAIISILTGGSEFHIYPFNSKITSPRGKSVTIKNVTNKISDNFCPVVLRVKHPLARVPTLLWKVSSAPKLVFGIILQKFADIWKKFSNKKYF